MSRVVGESLKGIVNGNQEWHLDEERQAACERRSAVFLVQFAHFFTQFVRIVLVLLLDPLHFRLDFLHGLHGLDLF